MKWFEEVSFDRLLQKYWNEDTFQSDKWVPASKKRNGLQEKPSSKEGREREQDVEYEEVNV